MTTPYHDAGKSTVFPMATHGGSLATPPPPLRPEPIVENVLGIATSVITSAACASQNIDVDSVGLVDDIGKYFVNRDTGPEDDSSADSVTASTAPSLLAPTTPSEVPSYARSIIKEASYHIERLLRIPNLHEARIIVMICFILDNILGPNHIPRFNLNKWFKEKLRANGTTSALFNKLLLAVWRNDPKYYCQIDIIIRHNKIRYDTRGVQYTDYKRWYGVKSRKPGMSLRQSDTIQKRSVEEIQYLRQFVDTSTW